MDREAVEKMINYLKEQEGEMIDFLSRLVTAESPSLDKNAHAESHKLLIEQLKLLDYDVTKIKGISTGGHLYASPKNRNKKLQNQLLIGHSDTVWPLNTIDTMELSIEDGKIKGPGVFDMKAGLTQILFSLRVIRDLNLSYKYTPLVLINSDEEIGSKESTKYIKWLSKSSARAFILEPPLGLDGKLKTARKGIGRYTLEIEGEAAHAGLDPGKGASAILELSHQIQNLFALNDLERGITVNVGLIEGGERANVIAPVSKAVVDVRVPTISDAKEIEKKIFALKPSNQKTKLRIKGAFGRPPMEFDKKNEALWEKARKRAQLLDMQLENAMAGGGSDGNTTSLYIPTLDGLGTTGDGAHALHEFAYTKQLLERTALLCLLITSD